MCIRWVDDKFAIFEDPLELINLSKTDAATITNALKDCLVRFCLCHGHAYDGASNMSGHLNGVAATIEKDVPAALYLHCAHCTNLCLQSVCRKCASIRDSNGDITAYKIFS